MFKIFYVNIVNKLLKKYLMILIQFIFVHKANMKHLSIRL